MQEKVIEVGYKRTALTYLGNGAFAMQKSLQALPH
jgi:hypothetical protein